MNSSEKTNHFKYLIQLKVGVGYWDFRLHSPASHATLLLPILSI